MPIQNDTQNTQTATLVKTEAAAIAEQKPKTRKLKNKANSQAVKGLSAQEAQMITDAAGSGYNASLGEQMGQAYTLGVQQKFLETVGSGLTSLSRGISGAMGSPKLSDDYDAAWVAPEGAESVAGDDFDVWG